MNMAKKLVALVIAFVMLISTAVLAEEAEDIFAYLSSLGIMIGDETGDFRVEDNLTRAEFSAIAARLLRVPDIKQQQVFEDVPSEHWANGYISQIYKMGVINGTGNNLFSPDSPVTYEQAIKILVGVLGYGNEAEKNGGYPLGYLGIGGNLKLSKGLDVKGESLTRGEIAQMVYNALQAHPLTSYGTPDYTVETKTLGEILKESMDIVRIAGVVTETHKASLTDAKPGLAAGEALIDGVHVKTDVDLKVGYYAEIYAEENRGKYTLVNVNYPEIWNNVTVADAEEAVLKGNLINYIDDNEKEQTVKLDDFVVYMYNGRKIDAYKALAEGNLTFVDNNADRRIDVVFMDEYESFLVSRVNKDKSMVYFDKSVIFRGRNGIDLDVEDEEKFISIKDKNGNTISVSDIEAGYAVTIKQSEDGESIEVMVSSDAIEGAITEVSDKGFFINETEYKAAYANSVDYSGEFALNDTGVFTLDCFGRLVGLDNGTSSSGFIYAYCIDAGVEKRLGGEVVIQTINSAPPVKEVDINGDDEIISYVFQNNDPEEFKLSSKLKFNGSSCNSSDIDYSTLADSFVAYKLNSNGEIKELYHESLQGRGRINYTFNAEEMAFGGESVTRGFVTDKNTSYVLVPRTVSSMEDYMVGVTLTDEQATCRVYGTVFFADSKYESTDVQPVNILMIKADMNSSLSPVPTLSDDVCIVGEVTASLGSIRDDAGESVYKITLLNGTELKEEVTASYGAAFNVASTLRKGDLIRYKKDGFGRINSISKICSIQGLKNDFSEMIYLEGSAESAKYGYVYNTVADTFDYYSISTVDKLILSFSADGGDSQLSSELKLLKKNGPPIYLYNRQTGWIEPGTIDDALASAYAGTNASKALVLMESNEVKTVVIIED